MRSLFCSKLVASIVFRISALVVSLNGVLIRNSNIENYLKIYDLTHGCKTVVDPLDIYGFV